MRRKAKPTDPRKTYTRNVVPVWPWFFWKRCGVPDCGHSFRREWGWRVWQPAFRYYSHVCGECAETPREAERVLVTGLSDRRPTIKKAASKLGLKVFP